MTTAPTRPAPTTRTARRPGGRGSLNRNTSRVVGWALVPAGIVLLVFFLVPLVALIRIAMSSWSGVGEMDWVGFDNFVTALTNEPFYAALWHSVVLAAIGAAGTIAVALVLAAFVSSRIRGSSFYRVLWFLPAIAPASAVSVFWALSVQPRTGLVNQMLGAIGLGDAHAWLSSPDAAIYVIAFVIIWHGVGFAFLLLLGAMEEIPVSVNEAAALDGVSTIGRFFRITLPLIRPVLGIVALLNVIWAFNGFTFVWGITQGGPGNSTEVLPVLVYKQAFVFGNFGPAAAMSILGGVVLLAIGLFTLRGQKSTGD
ncbi:carbohydrate ABC transporter permease [Compostimonas suwonensis]|uniref:Raffinose/stachyose/melibiose transport system permease protein n=1 Tax=Compostimonas suwonensis TaxID=1048394 RepID=A0A2M9C519_9MICO|nr:sugar ABC transporter permease [Compostimonas suwonensis]PJJ65624.1 raffinose/stachyose/melibiose transport system permease protein [Compostimonas suwonensis]